MRANSGRPLPPDIVAMMARMLRQRRAKRFIARELRIARRTVDRYAKLLRIEPQQAASN